MTVAERAAYEGRIVQLEDALERYMRAIEMADCTVTGDLRNDFLEAYAPCLMALPSYRRAAPLGSQGSGEAHHGGVRGCLDGEDERPDGLEA